VRRLLADQLQLPVSKITLLRGQTSRQKDLLLAGMTPAAVLQRLQGCIGDD
jgi:uncharacterized protein YggU (UPF0235/DUF167 family)